MEENSHGDFSMDFPHHFMCPISMELMEDPVTISTGVTYDRKSIEKWFHIYKKKTCPATMQSVGTFEMTPNHTLKRLIAAWRNDHDAAATPPPAARHDELEMILATIDTTPFKVSSLKKLRSIVETGGDETKSDLKKLGGIEVLVRIMVQVLVESYDFVTIRACEEALGVLHHIPISDEDGGIIQILMSPSFTKSAAILLQRGSSEARYFAISTFRKIANADQQCRHIAEEQSVDFFKSLLETASDEICSKTSSCALKLLIETANSSKKSRLKAIEAGAMRVLIELLPEAKNGSRCERIMQLIKTLCGCAEGRLAFIEHGLGIAAVSEKMLKVSSEGTRIGVKILWLVANFHPREGVLEEMLLCGAVKKLVAVLHIGGSGGGGWGMRSKDRVVKILKLHGGTWRRYPCFPTELKSYLGLGNDLRINVIQLHF